MICIPLCEPDIKFTRSNSQVKGVRDRQAVIGLPALKLSALKLSVLILVTVMLLTCPSFNCLGSIVLSKQTTESANKDIPSMNGTGYFYPR